MVLNLFLSSSCGNTTAAEPLCSIRSGEGAVTQNAFIYIIVAAVLFTVVLIVVMVLSALRRWYKPLRPKIKKTYVVRKNVTPMTYTPTPTERCEITIENCCNMEYCETVSTGCLYLNVKCTNCFVLF